LGKHLDGDRQQDDAKNLAQNIDAPLAQPPLDGVDEPQHQENER
jgi:hypothetical protein